jgi:succinyl-diaminopimelate desuccinylase
MQKIDKQALRQDANRRISKYAGDLASITQELVRIPSINPPGDYQGMADRMLAFYRAEGLAPLVAAASRQELEDLGLTWPRPNVIARIEGKEHHPVFCLDAHMDVVGVGDESLWTYPPFSGELHEGRIYGRGSADTKCHLAIQLIVARVIREMGLELTGDLILSASVDDEIGAWPGMGFLLEKGFQQHGFPLPDFHIAGEPTGIGLCGCLARGRVWYDVSLRGRTAHGGNPKAGINAIEKAIALANAFQVYPVYTDPMMGADTINIGIIQGGEAINVVAGSCRITFDIRPATKKEVVKDWMDKTLRRLSQEDPGFVVERLRILNDRQTGGIGPEHEFVKTIQAVVKEQTGKHVQPTGDFDGYSSLGNAYWTSQNGIAGVMYGAGEFGRAHSVDEYITVDELVEMCQVFMGLVIELCA